MAWWTGGAGGDWLATACDDGHARVFDVAEATAAAARGGRGAAAAAAHAPKVGPARSLRVDGVPRGVCFLDDPGAIAVAVDTGGGRTDVVQGRSDA